jgi:hypothetical protein
MNHDDLGEMLDLFRERMGDSGIGRVSPAKAAYLHEQAEHLIRLSEAIRERRGQITTLERNLDHMRDPDGTDGFLELGHFEGYNSLRFFHLVAETLDSKLTPSLKRLDFIRDQARQIRGVVQPRNEGNHRPRFAHEERSFGRGEYDYDDRMDRGWSGREPQQMSERVFMEGIQRVQQVFKHSVEALGIAQPAMTDIPRAVYRAAVTHFRYLQKRFLDIGGDNTRPYRAPWDADDSSELPNLDRVPYTKISLIDDNPLLTDLLLSVSDNLPRRYTRMEKVEGRRKPKEVKHLDDF